MQLIKKKPLQSLIDMAVEHTGKVDTLYAIAAENAISITHTPPDTGVSLPRVLDIDRNIVQRFAANKVHPVSSRFEQGLGIGFMIIEETFNVQ